MNSIRGRARVRPGVLARHGPHGNSLQEPRLLGRISDGTGLDGPGAMNDHEELIPTRRTLLSRLKDWNDQQSWKEFFDTYWKLIYGVARKSGLTETESQDVVQETMVSVARQMPTFKYDPRIGSFKAWLLNLTRWRMGDQFRRRGPRA